MARYTAYTPPVPVTEPKPREDDLYRCADEKSGIAGFGQWHEMNDDYNFVVHGEDETGSWSSVIVEHQSLVQLQLDYEKAHNLCAHCGGTGRNNWPGICGRCWGDGKPPQPR
jgi:hypothetical protein